MEKRITEEPIGKDFEFRFGKHKGETVEEVLKSDPSYLIWAAENIEWFDLDSLVLEEATTLVYIEKDGGNPLWLYDEEW